MTLLSFFHRHGNNCPKKNTRLKLEIHRGRVNQLRSKDVIFAEPGNLIPQPLQSPSCYAQRFQVRFGGQFGLSKIDPNPNPNQSLKGKLSEVWYQ